MKKLNKFAFYVLATPVMALGAGSVMAQPSTGLDTDHAQLIAQRDGSMQRSSGNTTPAQNVRRDGHSDSKSNRAQHRGHMHTTPGNAKHASDMMNKDVKTADGENIGSIDDLIIDDDGQIVAIIVGVGGFLGMGEKDVAIGWDNVTHSASNDDEVRVDVTRDDLRSAQEFKKRD